LADGGRRREERGERREEREERREKREERREKREERREKREERREKREERRGRDRGRQAGMYEIGDRAEEGLYVKEAVERSKGRKEKGRGKEGPVTFPI
jgi:hypothetical protein